MRKLFRFGFYHFYHGMSWTYDVVASIVSGGRWLDWGRVALQFVEGPRVLELGFGPGHLQMEMNRLGLKPAGLDESPQMVRRARVRLNGAGYPAALLRGLAQALPFASQSFNGALATFPTEYILDPRTLSELLRVLMPGGRLVIVPSAILPNPAARWLLALAGQSGDVSQAMAAHWIEPFTRAGFQAQFTQVDIREYPVFVILATKPA